ncbi:MAG: LysR family transcriptional regulator [Firmicutes bacterium]|nr:LysR family transcriptional regulator [Bacillota bacterium]
MLDHRIDTFLTLCDVMNYRETAELLHMSQPAVTQHIQFLERNYQCRLFTYENRHLIKTEAASLLEEYARAMRYHEEAIQQKLREGGVRQLKIGATKTIGDYVITQQIHRYLSDKDNALTLIVDNTEHLLKLLEENQLDFAIVEGYFDKKHFASRCLRHEPFVGICRKGHPFSGREITIDELLTETIIHREEGSGTRAILEQKLQGYNESLDRFRNHICISSFKLILDLVKEGFGVSFVYNVLADSDPQIEKFSIQGEPIVREFSLVHLKHTDVQDKIDLFFEEMPLTQKPADT